MKVIFLDIDGVLNSHDNLRAMCITKQSDSDVHGHLFDSRCVLWLKHIIDKTDAKIVISSSWRMAGLKRMKALWADRNLPGDIIDVTSLVNFDQDERGNQIKMWLDGHSVDSFVIIDDDIFDINNVFNASVIVHTDGDMGLTFKDAQRAVNILMGVLRGMWYE